MPWVGWGCGLADFDNDGWPDNFVANGHVDDNRQLTDRASRAAALRRNVPLLFAQGNGAGKRFQLSTRDVGPYFDTDARRPGAAFGDLDDDGDIDIVVNHKDGPPALLRNDTPGRRTTGSASSSAGPGATATPSAPASRSTSAAGRSTASARGACSMESANDPRLLIGVGPVETVPSVTIQWPRPSTARTVLTDLKTNQTIEVVEPPAKAD